MRASAAMPMIFALPVPAVMMAEAAESKNSCTRPPIRSLAASDPPLYGTCTACVPVFCRNISP